MLISYHSKIHLRWSFFHYIYRPPYSTLHSLQRLHLRFQLLFLTCSYQLALLFLLSVLKQMLSFLH